MKKLEMALIVNGVEIHSLQGEFVNEDSHLSDARASISWKMCTPETKFLLNMTDVYNFFTDIVVRELNAKSYEILTKVKNE